MSAELRAAREKTVRDHMRLETELDFEAVLKTFVVPRYELYGQGTVMEGDAAVMEYFAARGPRSPTSPTRSSPCTRTATPSSWSSG